MTIEQLESPEFEHELDQDLRHTIFYLRDNWFTPEVGIVAATLKTRDSSVTTTSIYLDSGRWLHAEAHALKLLKKNEPHPSDLTAVVTLSPCTLEASATREGDPCFFELLKHGVRRIHFGCLDEKQVLDFTSYLQYGIYVTQTNDSELQRICKNLYELFARFSNRQVDGNPWVGIKKEIGLEPWQKK